MSSKQFSLLEIKVCAFSINIKLPRPTNKFLLQLKSSLLSIENLIMSQIKPVEIIFSDVDVSLEQYQTVFEISSFQCFYFIFILFYFIFIFIFIFIDYFLLIIFY